MLWFVFEKTSSVGGVFLLTKDRWKYSLLTKATNWPRESIDCATKVGGEEKSQVCSAIDTLSKLLVLGLVFFFCFGVGFFLFVLFVFLSNYRSKYRPDYVHVRKKLSDNFYLIMLQPVIALRHNCRFH